MGSFYLQGFVPMMFLQLMIALTRDGGKSCASLFLNSTIVQWFGQISMGIYLVHVPLMSYCQWLITNRGQLPPWGDDGIKNNCKDYEQDSEEW